MPNQTLSNELTRTTADLFTTIRQFNDDSFNEDPGNGKWSAASICEHILKFDRIANHLLNAKTIASNRPSTAKVEVLRGAMKDMQTKRVSPEFVAPSGNRFAVEEMIDLLKPERDRMQGTIANADLDEACIAGKHPVAGTLTRVEWLNLIVDHTDRHIKQLKALRGK
jgi:hypothetical protein